MTTRRTVIQSLAFGATFAPMCAINGHAGTVSPLIYLSPFKGNGQLSRCQAEVWFVADKADFVVVTAVDAWRAKALGRGLDTARVWVGNEGQWQRSRGRYKSLPSLRTTVAREDNTTAQARLLTKFGQKYAGEWGAWGPRFKRGLADGSRVMLRYKPTA
ncbi:MAG: hypothetical protein P8L31_08065 [Pseudomonadales bacterium]|nr:hypothetical protein [Pseudomonadales bacterium]